ncbi:TrbI/VirB10 family protein [Sphingomonas sp. ID1715]|uniref:TrbI/VirB10 family protein n=1 Tax=Sphingomonadales TaxID=204457 RepID=UPI00073046E7|nr:MULTISPECIES: TrbI/VirB10 family protein [Sphingomonadales]MBU0824059.1 TrbI/VirB10 family protein [Alphaproteobacteria bacterium]MCG2840892.1 TrbI/VirB10 family protein [Sandaracinobacteroides sayramensis]NNM75637.1 TrbI/VirB10 family protein [Sphingomonas sp. ID1715]PHQ62668.1 MAG: conjugal transfer protein TrbI [Sphingobium sp.]KTE26394.1 conjugal transfer protein TrbI [Sphingopyxis sp. H057]
MTDPTASSAPIAAPKADPETLVLRAAPGRVTRFRRGAIVAIAAAGSTAIIGVAWLALKPATLSLIAPSDEKLVGAKAPPDALAGAPTSYGDVPKLGPPLPGDLGRPILERQRQLGGMVPPDPAADAVSRAAQEAEAERQRIAAEQKAARESGVMLQLAGGGRAAAPAPVTTDASVPPASAETAKPLLDPDRDPNAQGRKNELVGRANRDDDINPHALAQSVSPWILQAGSIIAASLITGLNSDLPGLVTAQITENVYDSVTGRGLLIPQGSRLIGSYDSVVAFGQSRALVVWQRIILPDGSSIRIDNVPATDTQGYAGLSDRIDRHTWQLLKGVALSTLLGVGTELSFGSTESDLVRAIRESAQQSGARASDQLVTRNLNIQPTLRVRPGWPLRVVVHKDIILPGPWGGRHG